MSDPRLYEQAAICHQQAGYPHDAARCYRLAGAFRRAAELHVSLGAFDEAADDYERAGMHDLGAWLLAHRADDPAGARAMLSRDPSTAPASGGVVQLLSRFILGEGPEARAEEAGLPLRRRVVLARCHLGEGARQETVLPVVADVCAALADPEARPEHHTEEWAVALCEHTGRYDQAALVFAAAVRGGRHGAGRRWKDWALRTLGTEITIPVPPPRRPSAFTSGEPAETTVPHPPPGRPSGFPPGGPPATASPPT